MEEFPGITLYRFAVRVAAVTCSVAGPDLPWQSKPAQLATADHA